VTIATGTADAGIALALRDAGLALPDEAPARFTQFVEVLAKWNRTYNLTSIREPAQMITHHVLDSLAILPHLQLALSGRVLDVGTGGGMPGIPLAIARPDWRFVLLDSNHKKIAFVTQAVAELGLRNVEMIAERVERYQPSMLFDAIVSRAFSDLSTFIGATARLLARGGRLYAMKGVRPDEEIAALPASVDVIATPALSVPGLDAARHLIVMQPKRGAT
jgi:16S rRNA (guanine527-N7)-methyltransferase